MRRRRPLLAQTDRLNFSIEKSNKCMRIRVSHFQDYSNIESLKEENWNMHLRNQELQSQVNGAMTDSSKFATENARLLAQNTSLTTVIESLKVKNAELSASLADSKSRHDMEMSAL